ncbi:MAG TPA: hypothetical protein VMW53_11970 [archaeon]|nr:hypothetical protein [archaeon]
MIIARILRESFEQNGVLSKADVAEMLGVSKKIRKAVKGRNGFFINIPFIGTLIFRSVRVIKFFSNPTVHLR